MYKRFQKISHNANISFMEMSPESKRNKIAVWVDYDFCTGCGLCVETAPEVFGIGQDGFARVKRDGELLKGGPDGLGEVAPEYESAAKQASVECPGQAIIFERIEVN